MEAKVEMSKEDLVWELEQIEKRLKDMQAELYDYANSEKLEKLLEAVDCAKEFADFQIACDEAEGYVYDALKAIRRIKRIVQFGF